MKTSRPSIGIVVLLLALAAVRIAIAQDSPTKIDLNALTARGEVLANEDPLTMQLRDQQADDSSRLGFYIGMAVAEGQTLPGPGKQRIGASLPATQQRGYNIAVSFSLERNSNADLAARGAAITAADEKAAAARDAGPDVYYRLGFNIATGIFGDAAKGALGNTQLGPGSLKIRDSLSAGGQRGFNAAVKFHLGQEAPTSPPRARPRTPGETSVVDFSERDTSRDKAYAAIAATNNPDNPYEIRCRGGRDAFIFTPESSKQDSTGSTIIIELLTFQPSSRPAGPGGEGLNPGQCSWVDRPMNERFLIRFETPANAQLKQALHGSQVDRSPTAAESFPDVNTIPQYLTSENHYWSFFGAKPVNNFFTATGHKFWKPGLVLQSDDPLRKKHSRVNDALTPVKP